MSVASNIQSKLTVALNPTRLVVTDDSHRHVGHPGARPGGESHFSVTIVSPMFEGQSRVARQRLVYGVLAEELRGLVHALAVTALAPREDAANPPS